jgi:hypothetical protein
MHPYRIAGIVLGGIAAVMAIFLLVGVLLPSGWEVERSRFIPAPPAQVHPHLASADGWGRWTPTPDAGVELFGPPEGAGSGRRWDDPGYGKGEFVITRSAFPSEVEYAVDVEDGAIRIQGRLVLLEEDEGTRVHWREEGDFGWNPLLGYLAGRMNELQGAQLEASLEALERLVVRDRESARDLSPDQGA